MIFNRYAFCNRGRIFLSSKKGGGNGIIKINVNVLNNYFIFNKNTIYLKIF